MGLASFAVYVLSDPTHVLDANKAFVSLSLFNILQVPMTMLPTLIQIGIMVRLAFNNSTMLLLLLLTFKFGKCNFCHKHQISDPCCREKAGNLYES